ncbi:putative DNA helicase DnaB-like protein [Rhizobium phage RHEph12]|nr:putative DNA helicase DnaB-like protein [Rhizobium phage RHEph12]
MSRTDIKLELKMLRTICDGSPKTRGYILPLLKELHFASAATQALFRRVLRLHLTGDVIPTWHDLTYDPGVSTNTRKMMRSVTVKPMKTTARIDSTMSTLERLRQIRALYELGANLEKGLDEDAVDPMQILAQLQKDVGLVGSHAVQTRMTRIGTNANVKEALNNIFTKNSKRRIPTGIEDFDVRNVGFVNDGVVLLAANTGGGKSALLDQIIHNMANQGANVAFAPLEMDAEENITRSIARVTGESMGNLIDPDNKITKRRQKELRKAYLRYSKRMAARGGGIDIIEPGFAANIENMLSFVDPLGYDVVAIDYVGLMDGVNGDDQWRALSNAVAYAKRWASRPGKKTLVIFAAQITEEGYLKNSKAMADHATNVWRWRVDEDVRESGIVVVHQDKCRGGAVFDIPMKVDFEHMLFRCLTKSELEDWQMAQRDNRGKEGKSGGARWKPGGKKGGKQREKKPELEEDEDDEEANSASKLPSRKVKRRTREL